MIGPGRSGTDKARIHKREYGNNELRTANEILKEASAYFAGWRSTAVPEMIAFIGVHRAHAAVAHDPGEVPDRPRRVAKAIETIKGPVTEARRCGVRKVWHHLHHRREMNGTALCIVERLMQDQRLQGVSRDRKKTAIPDPAWPCPEDNANDLDKLRLADSSYMQPR